ncbi:hypothetical protein Tco_0032016 [Tanacetum coccineum]
MDVILDQISYFNRDMNIITEEVRMVQHKYENPLEGRISNLEETLNRFIKESLGREKNNENMVWEIKKNYDQTFKAHASSIKKLESHLGKIAELIQDRETDVDEDHKIPIILGRPFLATAHAMIDVFNKKISFKIGNETEILPSDPLDSFLFEPIINYEEGKTINLWEDDNDKADQYADSGMFSNQNNEEPTSKPTLFTANTKEPDKQISKLKELLLI